MLACKLDSSIQGTLLAGRAGSLASQASQPANVTMFSCYYSLLESPFPYKSCLRVHSSMKAESREGSESYNYLEIII